jgi:hypothetical protein
MVNHRIMNLEMAKHCCLYDKAYIILQSKQTQENLGSVRFLISETSKKSISDSSFSEVQ